MVITKDFKKSDIENLQLQELEIIFPKSEKEILQQIANVNILFGNPPMIQKYINIADNLEWFQSSFAWIDSLVKQNLKQDYILTNVKDTYGKEMSEYVFAYILMLRKQVLENIEYQKDNFWNQKPYPSVQHQTIAIMWTWSIGKQIAKTAKSFWMKTIGLRTKNQAVEYFDEIYTYQNIENFLSQADYVIWVLPSTKDTHDIINKTTLSHMKKTCIYINVWRWNNVNEEDIIYAVENKVIAFAVLDVFKVEPLPKESKLWNITNLIITPHISGYMESTGRILEIFWNNYNKFIWGKELDYLIDFKKWY